MIDTFIGIVSFGYSVVTGVRQGRQLSDLEQKVEHLGRRFERLDSGSLYLPDTKVVRDTTKAIQDVVRDTKTISGAVEKLAQVAGSKVAATRMILTPENTKRMLADNPWNVLVSIHPRHEEKSETPRGMLPVLFEFQGLHLVGYQSIGALRLMLGLDITADSEIWLPESVSKPAERVARNERCPCGSGNRFKHCCGRLS